MISYLEIFEKLALYERVSTGTGSAVSNRKSSSDTDGFIRILEKSLSVPSRGNGVARQDDEKSDCVQTRADEKFKKCLSFVLEKEGVKFVVEDGTSRESSKMGILQSTARQFGYKGNVKNLNAKDAERIYRKVWEQSGAASLPFPLALVHFDSYVNNPASSMKFLQKSNGDTATYLRLREQRYVRLASAKPEMFGKYLQGWKNRIKSLQTLVASHGNQNDYLRASEKGTSRA
ncbi:MAG TPA: glycosyl hydrolase 108 family protein [Syntrophorhabdaceae bacterium]|nr:glycosyl hydrolase 108 family protein [Syntrophorhabdaceae bacterium]